MGACLLEGVQWGWVHLEVSGVSLGSLNRWGLVVGACLLDGVQWGWDHLGVFRGSMGSCGRWRLVVGASLLDGEEGGWVHLEVLGGPNGSLVDGQWLGRGVVGEGVGGARRFRGPYVGPP